jgi:hypothetical protein
LSNPFRVPRCFCSMNPRVRCATLGYVVKVLRTVATDFPRRQVLGKGRKMWVMSRAEAQGYYPASLRDQIAQHQDLRLRVVIVAKCVAVTLRRHEPFTPGTALLGVRLLRGDVCSVRLISAERYGYRACVHCFALSLSERQMAA